MSIRPDVHAERRVDWRSIRAVVFGLMIVVAAFLLGIAGLAKLVWPAPMPFARFGELPRPGVVVIAVSEIAFAWWLVRGCFASIARWTAVLLFGSYLALLATANSAGVESCGCLGRVGIPADVMMLVDATMLLGFLLGRPRTERRRPKTPEAVVVAGLLLGLAVVGAAAPRDAPVPVVTGSTLGRGIRVGWNRMTPGTPIDSYRVFASTRPREPLDEGKWVLLYSRSDCDTCRAVQAGFETLAARNTTWRFAVVETSGGSSPTTPRLEGTSWSAFKLVDRDEHGRVTWIVRVPMFVVIEHGELAAVCASLEELEDAIDQGK